MKEDGLTITRIFDAPQEEVWRAWTDPERMKGWFGPKGFTIPFVEMDLRVSGKILICMESPEGQKFYSTGVYKVIEPLKKLVTTDNFADEHGNVVPASHYGMSDDFPDELLVTTTLEGLGKQTKMTIIHAGMPGGELGKSTRQSWSESFDKLEALLKSG